jgi:hypothetical protein
VYVSAPHRPVTAHWRVCSPLKPVGHAIDASTPGVVATKPASATQSEAHVFTASAHVVPAAGHKRVCEPYVAPSGQGCEADRPAWVSVHAPSAAHGSTPHACTSASHAPDASHARVQLPD